MNSQSILRCLPLLADVLGRAYGVVVEIGGDRAFTTGRVIRLPSLPATADATFLGLVRGYLDHEAAHIRHTDFAAMGQEVVTPLERHVWNIFEDWRVEACLAALFPGCRANFTWLIRHLFLDKAPAQGSSLSTLCNWLLLSVRSWSVPELIPLVEETQRNLDRLLPGLTVRLEPILASLRQHCPDSLACLDYARQVVRCLAKDPAGPAVARGTGSENAAIGSATTGVMADELQSMLDASIADLPGDLGGMLRQALGALPATGNRCGVATEGTKHLSPLSDQERQAIAQVTAGLQARLHGLLQSTRRVNCRPARRGRLAPHRLHAIAVGDPRVFQSHDRRPGLNTAVHILVDASSSMSHRINLTCQCCAAVAQALSRQGISVGITAFPGDRTPSRNPTVVPIMRHGDRVPANLLVAAGGQTPLSEALWWVLQQLMARPEERQIVLILTDGDPDDLASAKEAIAMGESLGVEIYGLGIEATAIASLLPHHSATVDDIRGLPSALFGLLGQALINHRREA